MAAMNKERIAPKGDPNEKKVKLRLPLTRTEKDDVFVGLNGRTFMIKRGEEVEVPEGVAEILRNREEVLMQIIQYEEQANRLEELK